MTCVEQAPELNSYTIIPFIRNSFLSLTIIVKNHIERKKTINHLSFTSDLNLACNAVVIYDDNCVKILLRYSRYHEITNYLFIL